MDRHTALELLHTTLAADYACQPGDWTSGEVIVVEAQELLGRRRLPFRTNEFVMTTLGRGAVICCSGNRLDWVKANLAECSKDQLFSIPIFALIADYVAQDKQILKGPALRYLCASDTFSPAPVPGGFTLEVFGQERMVDAYQYAGFHYAVSYDFHAPRPDMIAVAAWHNGQVIGMSGVSADSEMMWQVGVTVLPEYHGMGIGKALVSRVTEATLEQGKVPFYATWIANLASSNTALSVGYWLAWTDVYVHDQ